MIFKLGAGVGVCVDTSVGVCMGTSVEICVGATMVVGIDEGARIGGVSEFREPQPVATTKQMNAPRNANAVWKVDFMPDSLPIPYNNI